jgi:PAS domain S-box-containing protein
MKTCKNDTVAADGSRESRAEAQLCGLAPAGRRTLSETGLIVAQLIVRVNTPGSLRDCMKDLTVALQSWSGCEAVGIRLREGDDYPYYETRGFPPEFVQAENRLCSYGPDGKCLCDGTGEPLLECMCGNILSGRFDPAKPFFTAGGSFWTNGTTALLASTTEADRQARTRNRCNGAGYESVALIPIRNGPKIFGLLQFNDHLPNRFTLERITHFELMANSLAVALSHRKISEALRESEARFEQLAAQSKTVAWEVDAEGLYTYVNRASETVLGYCPEELTGRKHFYDIHPETGREAFKQAAFAVFERKGPFRNLVNAIQCKDGRTIWVSTHGDPCLSADGTLLGYRGSDTDITERRQTDSYRELSLTVLRILNEPGDLRALTRRVLEVIKAETGVDAAGLRLQDGEAFPYFSQLGFSEDFLLTESMLAAFGAGGEIRGDKGGTARLECSCGLVISEKPAPADPLFTRGGSFWTNNASSLLDLLPDPRNTCIFQHYDSVALIPIRNKDHAVGHLQLSARKKGHFFLSNIELLEDIASHIGEALQRRQAEEALVKAHHRLKSLIENSPLAVITFDREAHISSWSGQAEALFGWRAEEVLGKRIDEIPWVHEDDAARVAALSAEMLSGSKAGNVHTNRNYRKDGAVIVCEWYTSILRDASNRLESILSQVLDVSDRTQAADKIQRQLDELSQWYQITLGREDRVRQLKHEVNELMQQLGKPPRYPSQEDKAASSQHPQHGDPHA